MSNQKQIRLRSQRAENVASWYFRLNGFFSIPGFVVHPDQRQRYPRTEADLLGVRFPFSRELISGQPMKDDPIVTTDLDETSLRTVFVLVEVKTDLCDINGPWSDRQAQNMQRVVRRLGFADESLVENIVSMIYDSARWEDTRHIVQYVCVGARKNDGRQRQFSRLLQIDWHEVARFFLRRFGEFPEKLPDGPVHRQWPDFGRQYGEWFDATSQKYSQGEFNQRGDTLSLSAVENYIREGECHTADSV